MSVRILPLLISGFVTISFADSAVQTDWYGGPGVVGPVITLGSEFLLDTDVYCGNPFDLVLQIGLEHTVDDDFNYAKSVYSTDVNGDGYMDVLGGAFCEGNQIAWWDLTEYFPVGSLESSILNVQSDPDWQLIDWTCSTPTGTSVSFQVRASDDYKNMGAWSDTIYYPSDLEGILIDDDSYFQYKTIMQTTDPAVTPVLNDITISWDPVCIWETTEPIHPAIALLSIAPNPSVGSPVIRFGLPESSYVSISIFDLSGRLVMETDGSDYSSVYHNFQLLERMSPGVYFCRMVSDDFSAEQRFVVIE